MTVRNSTLCSPLAPVQLTLTTTEFPKNARLVQAFRLHFVEPTTQTTTEFPKNVLSNHSAFRNESVSLVRWCRVQIR